MRIQETHEVRNAKSVRTKGSKHREWRWELLAVAVSLLCMAGIVAVIARMNERPLSHWTFFLSLPATIAIFSTSAKSMAAVFVAAAVGQAKWLHFRSPRPLRDLDLLDDASRGPMGSLRLLYGGPWGLVSLGALVTLLAVGFDVSVQQVVRFDTRDVAVNDGSAVLGLSHEYIAGAQAIGSASVPLSYIPGYSLDG